MFGILWLCVVLSTSRAQDVGTVRELTPREGELCASGFFEYDTGDLDVDCCRYMQCDTLSEEGKYATIQKCMYPLVWNIDKCSCDYRHLVGGCENTPDSCYDPLPTVTPCPDDLQENECCLELTGLSFIRNENGTGYKVKGDKYEQLCPTGELFDLEKCICVPGENTRELWRGDCVYFPFDGNFDDVLQGTYMNPGEVSFGDTTPGVMDNTASTGPSGIVARFYNLTPATVPYFSKVEMGTDVTIMAWVFTNIVRGNLWDNGDGATGQGSTIFFTLDDSESKRRKRQSEGTGMVGQAGVGELKLDVMLAQINPVPSDGARSSDEPTPQWFHLAMTINQDHVTLYFDGIPVAQ
ncbi:unnamed protein product, partial [Owenia fusiformis]